MIGSGGFVISFSPEMAQLCEVLAGMKPPEADSDGLYAASDGFAQLSGRFQNLEDAWRRGISLIASNFKGEAADTFVGTAGQQLADVTVARGTAKDLEEFTKQTALQVEYSNMMVMAMLAQLMLDLWILWLTLTFFPAGAEQAAEQLAHDEARDRVVIPAVFRALMKFIGAHVFTSIGPGLGMDGAIQVVRTAEGHRGGWDWNITKQPLEFAGPGAVAGGLGKLTGADLGKALDQSLGHELSTTDTFGKAGTGLGTGMASTFAQHENQLRTGFPPPSKTLEPAAGPKPQIPDVSEQFADRMATVFAATLPHLANAGDIGRDFATTFTTAWGHRSLQEVQNTLREALQTHHVQLGGDAITALSHHVPDTIARALTSTKIGREIAGTGTTAATNTTLTEAAYNITFGPEHTPKVTGFGTASSTLTGLTGHLGRTVITHLARPKTQPQHETENLPPTPADTPTHSTASTPGTDAPPSYTTRTNTLESTPPTYPDTSSTGGGRGFTGTADLPLSAEPAPTATSADHLPPAVDEPPVQTPPTTTGNHTTNQPTTTPTALTPGNGNRTPVPQPATHDHPDTTTHTDTPRPSTTATTTTRPEPAPSGRSKDLPPARSSRPSTGGTSEHTASGPYDPPATPRPKPITTTSGGAAHTGLTTAEDLPGTGPTTPSQDHQQRSAHTRPSTSTSDDRPATGSTSTRDTGKAQTPQPSWNNEHWEQVRKDPDFGNQLQTAYEWLTGSDRRLSNTEFDLDTHRSAPAAQSALHVVHTWQQHGRDAAQKAAQYLSGNHTIRLRGGSPTARFPTDNPEHTPAIGRSATMDEPGQRTDGLHHGTTRVEQAETAADAFSAVDETIRLEPASPRTPIVTTSHGVGASSQHDRQPGAGHSGQDPHGTQLGHSSVTAPDWSGTSAASLHAPRPVRVGDSEHPAQGNEHAGEKSGSRVGGGVARDDEVDPEPDHMGRAIDYNHLTSFANSHIQGLVPKEDFARHKVKAEDLPGIVAQLNSAQRKLNTESLALAVALKRVYPAGDGQLPMRGGAMGFEIENRIVVQGIPLENKVLLAESDYFQIVTDTGTSGEGDMVFEIVTKPIAAIQGDEGRLDRNDTLTAVLMAFRKLHKSSPGDALSDIFPEREGFTLTEAGWDVSVGESKGNSFVLHITAGVHPGGVRRMLGEVLRGVPAENEDRSRPGFARKENLQSALSFGDWLAARYRGLDPATSDLETEMMSGAGTVTYLQAVALANSLAHAATAESSTLGGIAKSYIPVVSRVSLAGHRTELPARVRGFLQDYAAEIKQEFARRIGYHSWMSEQATDIQGPDILSWKDGLSYFTIGDYIDNMLLDVPSIRIGQSESLGVGTEFDNADKNGTGHPTGLILLEVRKYRPDDVNETGVNSKILGRYRKLESIVRAIDEQVSSMVEQEGTGR